MEWLLIKTHPTKFIFLWFKKKHLKVLDTLIFDFFNIFNNSMPKIYCLYPILSDIKKQFFLWNIVALIVILCSYEQLVFIWRQLQSGITFEKGVEVVDDFIIFEFEYIFCHCKTKIFSEMFCYTICLNILYCPFDTNLEKKCL